MKPQGFLEEDWDHIIIMDAARFDVFSRIYEDYYDGDLEKRKSPASATPEWAHKILDGRHNINWYSSNPFINSTGKPISSGASVKFDTVPDRHIAHIEDIWNERWSQEDGTVLPEDVNKHFFERRDQLADRRNVIHYMQPHLPIIGRGKGRINMRIQAGFSGASGRISVDSLTQMFPDVVGRLEQREIVMKLAMYSSLDSRSLLEVLVNDSRQKMMEFYEENMRKVMEHSTEIVEGLDGRTVITSDHGEAFGENGVWEHHAGMEVPELVEVPWLEVDSTAGS